MSASRLALSVLVLVVLVMGFGVGFLAGYLGRPAWLYAPGAAARPPNGAPCHGQASTPAGATSSEPPLGHHQDDPPGRSYAHEHGAAMGQLGEQLLEELRADSIREHLRWLVKQPRLAGTRGDLAFATFLREFFLQQGFHSSKLVPYNVLLSFPDRKAPSHVELYDRRENLVFTSQYENEAALHNWNGTEAAPPFSAYSAIGSPKAELVYINYATVDDFRLLRNHVDVTGRICIARRGKIHPSVKVANAQRFGAAGLILYTDGPLPGPAGSDSVDTDEAGRPDGLLRNTLLEASGDPLTAGYPSIASAFRNGRGQTDLPKIPVHPIRTKDAQLLLSLMRGDEVRSSWRGGLPITYHYGPGFMHSSIYRKVQIKITSRNTHATVNNVVSVIRGRQEPDRYVIISSHHDTWTSGAVDSTSGTAITMELGRAMGKLVQSGWRPRRTIVFCSWAATNYGLVGSTEWVEQFPQLLSERAVGVINVGMAVEGNYTFSGEGTPLAHSLMTDISKHILNPDVHERSQGRTRVYDTWTHRQGAASRLWGDHTKPRIFPPDPRSDAAPFISTLGVTGINVGFISKQAASETWPLSSCIACSAQLTLKATEQRVDPDYEFHLGVTRYVGELARRLSEHTILPYDVTAYSASLQNYLTYFTEQHEDIVKTRGLEPGFEYLQDAIATFHVASEHFSQTLVRINKSDPLAVRMVNDRLLSVERAFLDPRGLPGRPSARHALFAAHSGSLRAPFPGLANSVAEARTSTVNSAAKWGAARRHLALLAARVGEAAAVLQADGELF